MRQLTGAKYTTCNVVWSRGRHKWIWAYKFLGTLVTWQLIQVSFWHYVHIRSRAGSTRADFTSAKLIVVKSAVKMCNRISTLWIRKYAARSYFQCGNCPRHVDGICKISSACLLLYSAADFTRTNPLCCNKSHDLWTHPNKAQRYTGRLWQGSHVYSAPAPIHDRSRKSQKRNTFSNVCQTAAPVPYKV